MLQFIEELKRSIQGGRQVDLIIMDFTKAFDKVSHKRLLYKLEGFLIKGQIDSPTDCKVLQQDLSKLEIWEDAWKMDFNSSISKCFSTNINRKRNPLIKDYSLKGTTLVNTENSTYKLGVTIRKDLK